MLVGASRIRCLVVADHEVLRAGLVGILEREDGIEVIGQAGDAPAAMSLAGRRGPDVAILDVGDGTDAGADLCRAIAAAGRPTRTIVYTADASPSRLEQVLDAGASAYLLKAGSSADIGRAVRLVHDGHTYVDGLLASTLTRRRAADRRVGLSPREREVLQLMAEGLTTDRAAERLYLSPATVRSYCEAAMQKLETRNRTHAVARALRLQLIS